MINTKPQKKTLLIVAKLVSDAFVILNNNIIMFKLNPHDDEFIVNKTIFNPPTQVIPNKHQ